MTAAMVDRLFWRAGFGPTAGAARRVDRQEAVRARRLVPEHARARSTPRRRRRRTPTATPIDPLASDTELELEWIDRMQRAVNPFPDRLAFFWHRHWAISRDDGVDPDPVGLQLPQPAAQVRGLRRRTRTRRSGSSRTT